MAGNWKEISEGQLRSTGMTKSLTGRLGHKFATNENKKYIYCCGALFASSAALRSATRVERTSFFRVNFLAPVVGGQSQISGHSNVVGGMGKNNYQTKTFFSFFKYADSMKPYDALARGNSPKMHRDESL